MVSSQPFDLPPVLAGRYRVLGLLGRGAIAQVVRARDEKEGREVAVKVLYDNLHGVTAVAERFRREVQVVRGIDHPAVIRIHDLVEDDGRLFLVMELREGGDLADRLAQRGALAADELLSLAEQLCGALAAAHHAGVVHRDLKPQNVLLGAGGSVAPGEVRLCDFGLARTADLAGLTTRTTVLGTPEYMAPEVISYNHSDPRSDIYSLGVLLFEAATGALPFLADSPYVLLQRHLSQPPRRARDLCPSLPAALDAALDRALAKDPLDRFASAEDFLAALKDHSQARALVPATAAALYLQVQKPRRIACPRCGGEMPERAGTCVDCGARRLRITRKRGGVAVLVTGPGACADKLDGKSHAALVRLLSELPAGLLSDRALRRRPPRLPFFLLRDLDEESAWTLTKRLEELGFTAEIRSPLALVPLEVQHKALRIYVRLLGPIIWVGLFLLLSFEVVGLGAATAAALLLLTLPGSLYLSARPALRWGSERTPEHAALQRLQGAIAQVRRREDRRLLSRILDRLDTAEALGAGRAARLLSERADTAATALISLEQKELREDEILLLRRLEQAKATRPSTAAGAAEQEDAARALDRLREAEQRRGLVVADLLRTYSRLDALCLRLARSRALAEGAELTALHRELRDLEAQVEAEEEVGALLALPGPAR